MEKLITPNDLCNRYGISINTLYQWTSRKRIPYLKAGGKVLFKEQDLLKWEESRLVAVANTKLL